MSGVTYFLTRFLLNYVLEPSRQAAHLRLLEQLVGMNLALHPIHKQMSPQLFTQAKLEPPQQVTCDITLGCQLSYVILIMYEQKSSFAR